MNTKDCLTEYLAATNSEEYLTYRNYLKTCADLEITPVKYDQWDRLISIAAGRTLQDSCTEDNWLENLRQAVRNGD